MTKALAFIEQDIAKVRSQDWKAAALAAVVLAFSIILALALRPDVEDINAFYIMQSSVLGVVLFVYIWLFLSPRLAPRSRSLLWKGALVIGMALSLFHEGLHPFSDHGSLVRFWKEAGGCFSEGLFTGLVSGTILTFAVFRLLPTPDRRWQLGIASAASLSGLVMLNLHCPSTVMTHIVFGHWAHGLIVTTIIVQWQGALFRHKMKQLVGPAGASSGALDSLED